MSANGTVPQSQSPRRIATIDIETVPLDPADPKGALDAMFGRIACIGLLFDDGHRLIAAPICEADEKRMLERFWASVRDTDQLVGHNILEFDLMFIRQRSWILGVKPPIALNLKKYYTEQVVDLMALWTNWSNRIKGCTLENIAWALGCGTEEENGAAWSGNGHASDVATWFAKGDFASLVKSCMSDVWRAYRIYCRMHFREPLGIPLPNFSSAPKPAYDELLQALAAPQREMVPVAAASVPASAPAPSYFQAQMPQPQIPDNRPIHTVPPQDALAPRPPRPPRRRRSRSDEPREIFYRVAGNALVLSGGGTYHVKDTLKDILGARGSKVSKEGETPARYEWAMSADKWESLAGLCAKSGIQLVPAGNGRAA